MEFPYVARYAVTRYSGEHRRGGSRTPNAGNARATPCTGATGIAVDRTRPLSRAVRRRVARQLARLDHATEGEAVWWVEEASEFDT